MKSRRRYRGRYRVKLPSCSVNLSRHRYHRRLPVRKNNLTSLIGTIIVLIGIFMVFKNTMIYSGSGFSRGVIIGIPSGLAFVLLMIGIIVILCNKNSFVGFGLVGVGVLMLFIGILVNIRMVFMPINLLKAIMLFGFIAVGIAIIIISVFGNRR